MFTQGVQKIKLSKKFYDTCMKIGECKSREEEEIIVSQWMANVKKTLGKSKMKLSELYENVISLVQLTLLGYDTSFGHINAVNLTQDSQLMTKALGYLSCATLFDSQSQLLILIINSTQRDLSSQQPIPMALALTAICHLITPELIPPIIGYVGQALTHPVPLIRQKAVMCIHAFVEKDPNSIIEYFPELVRLLADPDITIVNNVINTFTILLRNQLNIRQIVECLQDVLQIASLIQSGQVKVEYTHQRVVAPFNLINIFQLFQQMAPHMPELAEAVTPILTFALQNGTTECSASAAILYEAIRTCIAIGIHELPQIKGAISLFMCSQDQNQKFIGLGLLETIPDFADEFQGIIIDCLEHPDPTIRLRTLGLLHAMASESNAQIIVVNMLRFFQRTKNERIRTELADRITSIATQYAPSPLWFAKTMEQLFALGGDHVRPEVAFAVMKLIDEKCTDEMRQGIVNLYIDVAQSGRKLSDVFVSVIAKVVGEYAELSDEYDLNFVALLLCDLADAYEGARDWVLNSLLQIISRLDEIPQQVVDVFENYKQSRMIYVQEICFEALALINFKDALMVSMEVGEIEDFDPDLAFLDDFVEDAIVNGHMPEYIPMEERETEDLSMETKTMKIKIAYDQPTTQQYASDPTADAPGALPPAEPLDTGLNTTGVNAIWTMDGISSNPQDAMAPQQDEYGMQQPEIQEMPQQQTGSVFNKFKKNKIATNTQEARREKMQNSLFGGIKKVGPKAPAQQAQSMGPMGGAPPPMSGLNAAGVPNVYGQPEAPVFSEEDLQQIQQASMLFGQPADEAINQFSTLQLQPIYQDQTIAVGGIAMNGSLFMAVTNVTPQPIIGFTIDINGPQVFLREVHSHPTEIGVILPNASLRYLVTFKFPQQMRGFPDFKFSAIISYNRGQPININVPMDLSTFIVPINSTTPQFGALWKQGGCEIIYSPEPTDSLTLDDICEEVQRALHVKTVQRIRQEEILIGQLFSTPFNVLVHIKYNPAKIEMKVLTKAQPLTQAIVNFLKTTFEG